MARPRKILLWSSGGKFEDNIKLVDYLRDVGCDVFWVQMAENRVFYEPGN
jgi:hypothetical protein